MPKKLKDPEHKRLTKLRSALRGVWQYDHKRKVVIADATYTYMGGKYFRCPVCRAGWPVQMATVDHEPELGGFTLETIGDWIWRLFNGPQRAICKLCHTKKPRGTRRTNVSH